MILDDVYPVDERGATLAEERGANWEAGVQVCRIISWTKVVKRRR